MHRVCLILLLSVSFITAAERPDIFVFLTDDQGQLDSQPYGATDLRTPHMQRLADAGMTFDNAYVASPSCAPSRAALLTGLMPARNGAEANHSRPRPELKKWPACFQALGYEVVAFGKVSHYKHTGDYGFDHFGDDGFHQHESIGHAIDWLANRPKQNAKPLCFMVGTNWPHVPWPETDLGYDPRQLRLPAGSIDTPATREWRAKYAAAVTRADDDLGRLLQAVKEHLSPDTLTLFTSDHGAQWPFGKWNLYESGTKTPLMVSWPGKVKPGSRSTAMVSWIDLLPTLVEAAGGTPPAGIDGTSFLPVLVGEKTTHREHIFTTHSGDGNFNIYPSRAVRHGRWKYIRNLHPDFAFTTHIDLPVKLGQRAFFATWEEKAKTDPAAAAIMQRYHQRPAEELYDLETDPHEQHNLATTQPDPLPALRSALDKWMQEQGDKQTTFGTPRLLTDPTSHGPDAKTPPPASATKKKKK